LCKNIVFELNLLRVLVAGVVVGGVACGRVWGKTFRFLFVWLKNLSFETVWQYVIKHKQKTVIK
jgi:hypothetical protein